VRTMRNLLPSDPQALAAASQRWMDAKNALERYRFDTAATPNNPRIVAAQANVDAATRARKALVDRFNSDLARDANYRQVTDAAARAVSDVAAAAQDLNAAEARSNTIAADINQLQSIIATEQDRLNQAAADAENLQNIANSAGWDVSAISGEVTQL